MASLSDQIDRLTQNTRSIKSTASQIAIGSSNDSAFPGTFTRAVLNTHLGDLIRDVDPSELGLFRLVQGPSNDTYNKDARSVKEPGIRRIEFSGATPLRKHSSRREDKQEIEPEVYAHAALKYIDQYEPIRPMPRAYDQIVTILNRFNTARANIDTLNAALEKTVSDKVPSTKARVEQEEQRVKDLQARIAELAKLKKENATQIRKSTKVRLKSPPTEPPKETQETPLSPSSPQEEKFWATKGEPRTLRFSENLLDEEVNLGDVSTGSFGTPLAGSSQIPRLALFGDVDFADEPTITLFPPLNRPNAEDSKDVGIDRQDHANSNPNAPSVPNTPKATSQTPSSGNATPIVAKSLAAETPTTRQRKIKMNIEVERIVSKIWATVGDIILSPTHNAKNSPLSVKETIAYLQDLSVQTPQSESPTASSASSISAESGGLPTFQQIQTAYLLTMLLSASPHYSMPLNQVKENLGLKAKSSGVTAAGQGPTRVLFSCMGKRLVKIDRGGREQIVKFDI